MILSEYKHLDKRLTEGRLAIEGTVVSCLWKNPDLFLDYKSNLSEDSFITEDGRFYYVLGNALYKTGAEVFDEATVLTFLQKNESLKEGYEKRGGYCSIKLAMDSIDVKNANSYIDNLLKGNMLISFQKEGFNIFNTVTITENDKDKEVIPFELFKNMNSTQVSNFYEWRIQSITLNKICNDIKVVDLDIDDKFLESCNEGNHKGLSFATCGKDVVDEKDVYCSPILSGILNGLHLQNLELIAAASGVGKSSFVTANRVMPIISQGESVVIFANEMGIDAYKSLILPFILANYFKYYKITRNTLQRGNFLTEENKIMIKKAQQLFKERFYKKIKFIDLNSYSINNIERMIKKMVRSEGISYFIYDTFKAEVLDANARMSLVEDSKRLFMLAKTLDIHITIVQQLAMHTTNRIRFLDGSCLAESKAIKEVVASQILIRDLWQDEIEPNSKYYIKPYRYIRDSKTGKFTNTKEYIQLDEDKCYKIVFIDKNRFGETGKTILYQFEGKYNKWQEIGFCHVSSINKQ